MQRLRVPALVLLLVSASLAVAADLPDSPAGKALAGWLDAIESADEDVVRKHFEQTFNEAFKAQVPVNQYVASAGQLRTMLTETEFAKVVEGSPLTLEAFVESDTAGWLVIRISVEPEPPHRIAGLLIQPTARPADEGKPLAWDTLADLVGKLREENDLPALAVAWMRGGELMDQAVVGVRAVGEAAPATPGSRFHVGSITKSITATMIGALVEDGKLAWDDTLAKRLPGYPMDEAYKAVTLRQLLRHRAGTSGSLHFNEEEMERLTGLPGSPTEQRAAYVKEVLATAPETEPGTQTVYSNAGYAVAGHVAELVAGKPWEVLVQEKVFDALGMASAGFGWPATEAHPDEPRGHVPDEGGLRVQGLAEYDLGAFLAPAGDTHMTVRDLARYGAFHLAGLNGNDGVLKAETVQTLHEPPEGAEYACGWMIAESDDGDRVHWHNGSVGTFYAAVAVLPDSGQVIAVATNVGRSAEPVALQLFREISRRAKKDSN